jgi:hypothetical protein
VAGVRNLQNKARRAIIEQMVDHIDRVVLTAPSDASLDALIDRMIAQKS